MNNTPTYDQTVFYNTLIDKVLKKRRWNSSGLALQLGVSRSSVTHWRSGKSHPRGDLLLVMLEMASWRIGGDSILPACEYVKKARTYQSATIDQLAEMVGVSNPTIRSWILGKTSPRGNHLIKLISLAGLRITRAPRSKPCPGCGQNIIITNKELNKIYSTPMGRLYCKKCGKLLIVVKTLGIPQLAISEGVYGK